MVTSAYMPDVKVEIAFNAGFNTPAASRTWVDVSDYVLLERGIGITAGRQDERSTAGANRLGLTLDNSDGRFTPNRSASPYYPNVKLDRPIRVTATPVGGTPSVRFLGFINEWPVAWDQGTAGTSVVAVSASSRLARLGLTAALRSIVEETFLVDQPIAYYPLGEPKDSTTAADVSGMGRPPLVIAGDGLAPPVVFGNAIGPGTDDLTAAQFAEGQVLAGLPFQPTAPFSAEFFAVSSNTGPSAEILLSSTSRAAAGFNFLPFRLYLDSNGYLYVEAAGTLFLNAVTTALNDSLVHHFAITVSVAGPTWTLSAYVDGTLVGTTSSSDPATGFGTMLMLSLGGEVEGGDTGLQGSISHAAFYDRALSADQVATHAASGLTGFEGDRTDQRLRRYASIARVEPAAIVTDVGSTLMAHVPTTGKQVVELMRIVETTEGGVLYDSRDGTTVLQGRRGRYTTGISLTLDMVLDHVEADYAPKMDRTALLNDLAVSNQDGSTSARYVNQGSVTDYGIATGSMVTASTDPNEPLLIAQWQVNARREPALRVPSLSVDVTGQATGTPGVQALLGLDLGAVVRVKNQPTQADRTVSDYFVEGYTETYGVESVRVTYNVSPSAPPGQVLLWGDTTRGLWDVNTWAY